MMRTSGHFAIPITLMLMSGCGLPFAFMEFSQHKVKRSYEFTDAETGRPISGVELMAWSAGIFGRDIDGRATTGPDGRASLKIVESEGRLDIDAPGYLTPAFEDVAPAADGVWRVKLFRGPAPICGIIVPRDYRGVLRIQSQTLVRGVDELPPIEPGQREFYTAVDPAVVNRLRASPRLGQNAAKPDVSVAKFDDGTPLRYENAVAFSGADGDGKHFLPDIQALSPPRPDGVALFHLGHYWGRTDTYTVFYVGLLAEAREEQGRWIAANPPGARPGGTTVTFRVTPLDVREMSDGSQMSPRWTP